MTIRLLTEHHLEFLSLNGTAQACLSIHIVGNHKSLLRSFIFLSFGADHSSLYSIF